MVKFNKYEYKDWQKFRMGKNDVITAAEFEAKMQSFTTNLETLFSESKTLENEIQSNLKGLRYE